MTGMLTPWLTAGAVAVLAGAAFAAWRAARPGRARPGETIITAFECEAGLVRLGWTAAGAGPNYATVYMNKGDERIALVTTIADPLTPIMLRSIADGLKEDEYAAGRRGVCVVPGAVNFGVAKAAARQDITLLHLEDLPALDVALAATRAAGAANRAAELHALTRAYDPPVPAPMRRAPAGAQPVFTTALVECFFYDRGGDDLVITFANQWLRADGRAFWADSVTKALGLSVVGFVAKEPCWYPADDMAALIPAVLDLLGSRFLHRTTYGHSQGGHAAIRYAAALGATATLAFSPQYSIDRRLVADARVNQHYTGARHAGMALEHAHVAGPVFVFHDPYEQADSRHAARIAASVPSHAIAVPFTGHASDRGMGDATIFAAILAQSRTPDTASMQCFIARHRHLRADRAVHMALVVAERRPRTAAAILLRHGESWKTNQLSSVCYKLAITGQAPLVFAVAQRAAAAEPENAHAQGTAGLIALELRELKLAFTYIERALALDLGNPKWLNAQKRILDLGTGRTT